MTFSMLAGPHPRSLTLGDSAPRSGRSRFSPRPAGPRAGRPPGDSVLPRFVVAIAGATFGLYVALRAAVVPLTYDEAAAYLRYISRDVLSVFDFTVATNHVLNTVLTRLFATLGDSELLLRIPSLIGYALYLAFSVLILRRLQHRVIASAALLLLNLNPYVLEYFSVSRGYGLSLGLLMGAIAFALEAIGDPTREHAERNLGRSLFFASAAVCANFALLNVYLGLLFVISVALVRSTPSSPVTRGAPTLRDRWFRRTWRSPSVWLALAAALYVVLVLSQDPGLSEHLYEPVSVQIVSRNDAELGTINVYRIDPRGRPEPLRRHGNLWSLDRRAPFYGLRIEVPVAVARNVNAVEVTAGTRPFRHDAHSGDLWAESEVAGVRTLDSRPSLSLRRASIPAFRQVINWRNDSQHAARVAAGAGLVLAILAVLALLLKAPGWVVVKDGFFGSGVWPLLSGSVLWTAAFAGLPLYLLKRNGELYYGGTNGLVADTYYSVIHGSFYGRTYHHNQSDIVFISIILIIVSFGVAVVVNHRRDRLRRMLPGSVLLGLLAAVSLAVVAQRLLFQTPYLLGRTAIFLIPLAILFTAFALDAIADLGRRARTLVVSLLAVAVVFSVYHFYATANVTYVSDWPQDAATKTMAADVAFVAARERPPPSAVSLGVEWPYYPVAVFYARRQPIRVDVSVLPHPSGTDFVYVEDPPRDGGLQVIRRYPVARSLLARRP